MNFSNTKISPIFTLAVDKIIAFITTEFDENLKPISIRVENKEDKFRRL